MLRPSDLSGNANAAPHQKSLPTTVLESRIIIIISLLHAFLVCSSLINALFVLHYVQGGVGGRIINTISVAGLNTPGYDGTLSWAGYCAAKFGNVAYTRIFASANIYENEVRAGLDGGGGGGCNSWERQ